MRGNAIEHSSDADVFVDVGPMDPLAATNDLVIPALICRGVREAP